MEINIKDLIEGSHIHQDENGRQFIFLEDLVRVDDFDVEGYVDHVKHILGIYDRSKYNSRKFDFVRMRRIAFSILKRTRINGVKVAGVVKIGAMFDKDHATILHHDKLLADYIETKSENIDEIKGYFEACMNYCDGLSYVPFNFKN